MESGNYVLEILKGSLKDLYDVRGLWYLSTNFLTPDISDFASMFVDQMEIFEYSSKFEIELSIFSG